MCALCGVLGGAGHWTEAVARAGVFTRTATTVERRRERAARVMQANAVLRYYRLTLSDWQGASFLLSTATGKTEIVDNLTHVWSAAEKLISRPCDPLDPALLAELEGRRG
jgi:hypothetical protein